LFRLFVQLARHATRPPAPTTAVIDAAAASRAAHALALVRGEVAVCRHWVRAAQAFAPALERAAALEEEDEEAAGEGDGSGTEALRALRDSLTGAAPNTFLPQAGEGEGEGDDPVLRACSDQALGEYCREAVLPLLDRALLHKKKALAAGTNSGALVGDADEQAVGARLSARCLRRLTPAGGVRLVRVRRGHRIRKVVVRRGVCSG